MTVRIIFGRGLFQGEPAGRRPYPRTGGTPIKTARNRYRTLSLTKVSHFSVLSVTL